MARSDVIQVLRDDLAGGWRMLFAGPERWPIGICSAPGRLDVLGGAGGLGARMGGTVAQMALPARVAVAVQLREDPALTIHCRQIEESFSTRFTVESLDAALPADAGRSRAAPIGALWPLLKRDDPGLRGAVIGILGAIPRGAAQASSTALLAAVAVAVQALRGAASGAPEIAALIRQAEERGGPCVKGVGNGGEGVVMDAMTCLVANSPSGSTRAGSTPAGSKRGGLLRYSSQPCELVGQAPLPENLRVIAMDTGVRSSAAAGVIEELRIAGAMALAIIETIYRDLGQTHTPLHGYLANTSPMLYRQYFRALLPRRLRGGDFVRTYGPLPAGEPLDPAALYRVRTAADHLIAENEHAEQFLQAIEELSEAGPDGRPAMTDPEERQRTQQRAGRLALASHHSYRLRLELSCPQADWLVDHLMEAGPERGIYGGRITGAGGGGTVMALVERSAPAGDAILEIMEGYRRVMGLPLSVVEAGGAGSEGALHSIESA